jgi:hypothetical protein
MIITVQSALQNSIGDLCQRTKEERRAASIEAMNRELPKICAMLDLDPQTLKPVENARKRA